MKEPFHTLMWKASVGYNDSWSQVDPEVLEKFAELIVRECVSIVAKRKDEAIDNEWNVDEAMSMAEIDIEEHFGVE